MAVVRKSGKGWQVLIRKKNYAPVYKTFISKAVAINWAQETELKIEQGIGYTNDIVVHRFVIL